MTGALVVTVRWARFLRLYSWRVSFGRKTRTGWAHERDDAIRQALIALESLRQTTRAIPPATKEAS